MSITTITLVDDANCTIFQDTDTVKAKVIATRVVWKTGTAQFNQNALVAAAAGAIATLNTAETLLTPGGTAWDTATPAQRSTLMLGLVRDVRALIRIALNILDQPS